MSASVPVRVQCERLYIKPYNPLVHISVRIPVPVPETASTITPSHCCVNGLQTNLRMWRARRLSGRTCGLRSGTGCLCSAAPRRFPALLCWDRDSPGTLPETRNERVCFTFFTGRSPLFEENKYWGPVHYTTVESDFMVTSLESNFLVRTFYLAPS